jgi:hypothetical protein
MRERKRWKTIWRDRRSDLPVSFCEEAEGVAWEGSDEERWIFHASG